MAIFGCVADDFTGASDAASFLVKGGLSTKLYAGLPAANEDAGETDAVVIALKSRTQEKAQAVADTLSAVRWLRKNGVKQFYIKYCSTFDSTPEGNIGPIADAVMEYLKVPYTILCPALPVNGRQVIRGELLVNGVPLNESPMKDHPLTPMWESRISELMRPQSRYPAVELWNDVMNRPEEDVRNYLAENRPEGEHFYVIPDYRNDGDAERIVRNFGGLTLLTGGSGILEALARKLSCGKSGRKEQQELTEGPALILCGSCSKATLGQIADYRKQGGICLRIDPLKLLGGEENADSCFRKVQAEKDRTVLLYSSDTAEHVKELQKYGKERVSGILESTTAEIAALAVRNGYRRILVAGGETSGAVTGRLGFNSYIIGNSVDPGVPVMIPAADRRIRLILKSGNFGSEQFFTKALEMTDLALKRKREEAVRVARTLFSLGRTTGSTGNLSFLHDGKMYITAGGSCFGTLGETDFAVTDLNGNLLSDRKPSKEWPLHLKAYLHRKNAGAVIHTHSTYAVLWSFVPQERKNDIVPEHTPYLKMKLGTVGLVPYALPGSAELFDAFEKCADLSDGFILERHGAVVPGKTVKDAFYCIEELEESARIAWELRKAGLS